MGGGSSKSVLDAGSNGNHRMSLMSDDDSSVEGGDCRIFRCMMFCPPSSETQKRHQPPKPTSLLAGILQPSKQTKKSSQQQQQPQASSTNNSQKKKKKKGASFDPQFGTPIPDTPPVQRLRRREMLRETSREDPIFSSRYSGLEKEASRSTIDGSFSIHSNTSSLIEQYERQRSAEIHEGRDAEQELCNKYELCEVLGVGSTSTCHRCIERATGIAYACKIIDVDYIQERFEGMLDQFHREISALRSLHHPNIVQLFDVYMTEQKIFIVMELMEGGELFDYVVEKGTLNEEEASRIVRKVTSAVVYMHSKNIVHRDLKPENLLLRYKPRSASDLQVKIIDFGLSKCMQEPVARSFLGTRGYLAPEMLQRRDYTRAVDTWALGVIAFVLLCGCLPFDDDSQTVPSDALVKAKFVLRFPRWANKLSPSAKDLLSHLLDINPLSRYTAEQALKHPWVTGKTASPDNLLESPGRIARTPNAAVLCGRGAAEQIPTPPPALSGKLIHPQAYNRTHAANVGPHGTPKRQLVRKTSI